MFNKLFLTFVICAAVLATALLFFENNKGLLPSQQSPWASISFEEPASKTSLNFFIENNGVETKNFTYTITTADGTVRETQSIQVGSQERKLITPAYTPDPQAGRVTIEVRDDLTSQTIYR
jgi:hypothetical protein